MRLLFSFFAFESSLYPQFSYRKLGNIGLNFSTTHIFSVDENNCGEKQVFKLACQEKEKQNQFPSCFWGESIYNISAIIGANGAGKSSLLHTLIKAIVKGLNPGVPFMLVLQKTAAEELVIYFGNGLQLDDTLVIQRDGILRDAFCTEEYPSMLKKAKIMLIDNTLSLSSIDLDKLYSVNAPVIKSAQPSRANNPSPIMESYKQFYNKSLLSSIRYSSEMSQANQPMYSTSFIEELAAHYRYESYQEIRFLFDKYLHDTIKALNDAHYPVPRPNYVYVGVFGIDELYQSYYEKSKNNNKPPERIPIVCNAIAKNGFWGEIIADCLFVIFQTASEELDEKRLHGIKERIISAFIHVSESDGMAHMDEQIALSVISNAQEVLDSYISLDISNNYLERNDGAITLVRDRISKCRAFINFVIEERENLDTILLPLIDHSLEDLPSNAKQNGRKIDIEAVNEDPLLRRCVINFLDRYRKASETAYFMLFSTGLSSGEESLLRMMTAFRYVLGSVNSPAQNADYSSNTRTKLVNWFANERKTENSEELCNTFILFLDEADLTYHPEWQRQLVSLLTVILPKMFLGHSVNNKTTDRIDIQVIMTTHSPLLLSDIPVQSCIFLEKRYTQQKKGVDLFDGEKGAVDVKQNILLPQTFGANIHGLLCNAFFLNRTIGEFAYQKILQIFSDLKKLEKEPGDTELSSKCRNYYQTIALIGDPIIRKKLQTIYNRCFMVKKNAETAILDIQQISKMSANLTKPQKEEIILALEKATKQLRQETEASLRD